MIFVKISAIENGWMVDIDSASDEPAIVACCYIVVLCRSSDGFSECDV